MAVYRGVLKRIGQGTWKEGKTTTTLFEIGDTSLRDISYSDYMKNYVQDALSYDGEVAVVVIKKESVVAVKIGDKIYVEELLMSPKFKRTAYAMILFGIPAIAALLLGLVFIYAGIQMLCARSEADAGMLELEAMPLA